MVRGGAAPRRGTRGEVCVWGGEGWYWVIGAGEGCVCGGC